MVFGKDFKEGDEAEEALERFESQKNQEKASLIINFAVPNSKEDIMEFMILAASNIDVKKVLMTMLQKHGFPNWIRFIRERKFPWASIRISCR